jgi:hypothetical protein
MAAFRRRFPTSMSGFVDYDSHGIVGFTDIVSNTVILDDVSPLSKTPEILAGALDLKFLPGIAHEAAHHACLDSPVGLALCSLWQSSFSLWWEQVGAQALQLPARDLAVASVANTLLQPLLEGIALFSEHDLFTGESPVISRVTQRVAPLFSRGRMLSLPSSDPDILRSLTSAGGDALFSAGHTAVLRLARSSDEWTERKQLLLSQSLKGSNRYLLGYLAVKGMYAALVAACPEFSDPELFFVAVVRHFLHDEVLTDILSRVRNKTEDPREAYINLAIDVDDLVKRFQDLFDELYANPKAVAKTAAESVLGGSSSGGDQLISGNDFFLGLRTVGTFNIAWPRLMKHRREFRFSFQPVLVRLARNDEATILDHAGQEVCRVPAVEGSRRASWEEDQEVVEFEGAIEAVQLLDLNTFVVCILSHNGLVAVFDCQSGQWNPEELVKQLDDMPSAIAVEGAMHAFAEWQSRTRGREGVREAIEFYETQARQAVDLVYPQLMFRGWETNRRDRVTQAFDTRGVFSIYRTEDEFRLAKLSLATGLFSPIEYAAQVMELERDKLSQLVAQFNETSRQACGFEPFILTNEIIASRI